MNCRNCGKDTKAPQNPGNNPGKWIVFENGLFLVDFDSNWFKTLPKFWQSFPYNIVKPKTCKLL